MPNPRRLTIFLPVALAVLTSGCGSSKTASTSKAASVNATSASAPANGSTQTASQSTGSNGLQQTSTTPVQTATNTTPKTQAPPSQPRTKLTEPKAPPKSGYQFPVQFKQTFLAAWTAANGSKTSGECVIVKYEALNVEKGRAIAELVGFQLALNNHLKLNRLSRRYAKECHSSIK